MARRKLALLLGLLASVAAIATIAVTAAAAGSAGGAGVSGTPTVTPITLDDSQLKAEDAVSAGAKPTPTDRTVAHWYGTATNPDDGVTYGFNMVGSDPNNCSGSACSTTIQADITPLIVNVDGMTFDGTTVVQPTIDSPVFSTNDYGSTPAATRQTCTYNNGTTDVTGSECQGPGGTLSQGDKGVPLQLEDATMRAQFNKTGKRSPYHLILHPNVLPAVTVNVPQNQGTLIVSGRGVLGADIDYGWWSSMINNLENSADPTHLPIYLTNQVFLYEINDPSQCCVIGYHGTKASGYRAGGGKTQGNGILQTFAWASYVQPGFYSRPDGGTDWALQDIHALSHEISEWADDPFVNNAVEPWLTPTAPQYGCSGVLETGDPVVGIGFAIGTNTFDQIASPNGTSSFDGYYHPEDEVFLPWFMRTAPNTISEPTQSGSGGRYTLMGDLNPFPGFRQPATGC